MEVKKKIPEELLKKYEKLILYLQSLEKAAIAFSGGVDSTFLLKAAKIALNKNVIALIAVSPVLSKEEEKAAEVFLRKEQIAYKKFPFDVFSINEFVVNPMNRCYYCKTNLMKEIKKEAVLWGTQTVLEGTNMDDVKDYRPGLKALEEQRILSPLKMCQFTKKEIIQLSRVLQISTWNKPSMACLASRIPYGEQITIEILNKVEQAEDFLKKHGFSQVRVRAYTKEKLVRIELNQVEFKNILDESFQKELVAYIKQLGFSYITLDLEGFRSGSMNKEIK